MKKILLIASLFIISSNSFSSIAVGQAYCIKAVISSGGDMFGLKSYCLGVTKGQGLCMQGVLKASGNNTFMVKTQCENLSEGQGICIKAMLEADNDMLSAFSMCKWWNLPKIRKLLKVLTLNFIP